MAISYDFDMATSSSAAQVASELNEVAQALGVFDASAAPELVLSDGVVTERGMMTQVFEKRPKPWHPVISDLGFTPTVSVMFRLDKMGEIPAQQDDMIRLVSGLLDRIPGDAVLHFQFEDIWLLRRGGELSVNERDDLWPPRRLASLSQPYCRVTHTFSEE